VLSVQRVKPTLAENEAFHSGSCRGTASFDKLKLSFARFDSAQDKPDKCRAPADTKTASALPVRRGYRPVVCEGSTVNGCSMRNSSKVSLGTRTCWP